MTATDFRQARANRRRPCPVCGKTDWCLAFEDGAVLCCRTESTNYCDSAGGWWHWPDGRPVDWSPPAVPPRTPRPAVDAELADAAYGAVLGACPLSVEHREALRRRGMTDDQLERGGYGTLTAERRRMAAAVAVASCGELVGKVAGFVRAEDGSTTLAASVGMLLPVRDAAGRIVALRVRVDGAASGGKYRWCSSPDNGGVPVDGNLCHVAYPSGAALPGRVLVTEGELKSTLAAERLRVPAIGVPGVGNCANVLGAIAAVAERVGEVSTVAIAFDADADTNDAVRLHRDRLARTLADAGYRVLYAIWSAEDGKGVDDALQHGAVPWLEPAPVEPLCSTRSQATANLERLHSATVRTISNADLGGDIGGKVAVLIAAELANQATRSPAVDGYYRVTGDRVADTFGAAETGRTPRVSASVVRKYVARWKDAGILDVQQRRESTPSGPVTRNYVRFDGGHVELLERFASATVHTEDAPRPKRGGYRLPTECPDCGGRTVALCTSCGAVHEPVALVEPLCSTRSQATEDADAESCATTCSVEVTIPRERNPHQRERRQRAAQDLVHRESTRTQAVDAEDLSTDAELAEVDPPPSPLTLLGGVCASCGRPDAGGGVCRDCLAERWRSA